MAKLFFMFCFFFYFLISYFFFLILILLMIAFFTLGERKVMAAMQRRLGPNVVGFLGILQPIADGLKVIFKEMVFPLAANKNLFIFAPYLSFILSLVGWILIPMSFNINSYYSSVIFNYNLYFLSFFFNAFFLTYIENIISFHIPLLFVNLSLDSLILFAISSLSVYGIIIAGWSSNSKYTFLGSMRSAAQMISYEVSLGFILVIISMLSGSLNFYTIVFAQNNVFFFFLLFPLFFIFFVSMLAETNRTPFDLPEAEAELVSGYNTEYSSIIFALFFLAEYSNMLIMSMLIVTFFFGGFLNPFFFSFLGFIPAVFWFFFKVFFFNFFFILVRGTLPRYRYDQLMDLGWKIFLPLTLALLFFCMGILIFFDIIPLHFF